jgi:hypothetical protein
LGEQLAREGIVCAQFISKTEQKSGARQVKESDGKKEINIYVGASLDHRKREKSRPRFMSQQDLPLRFARSTPILLAWLVIVG